MAFGANISMLQFGKELKTEISKDNVSNGAAALAYYLMLAIFPAMIFFLSVLPYLPIANLQQAVMDFINQALPPEAAAMFTDVVSNIMSQKRGGLLSFGILGTIWAASSGLYAVMQQLNIAYGVEEGRSFIKARATALLLMLLFSLLVISSFGLIVFGGELEGWIAGMIGASQALTIAFAVFRWVVIFMMLTLAFATVYWLGPNVEQKFKYISPGSVFATILVAAFSLLFNWYVSNFGNYSATYGSIGAVIILMLWLYFTGLVLLLGAEVNSLIEHHSPDGKEKGEKRQPENVRGHAPAHA